MNVAESKSYPKHLISHDFLVPIMADRLVAPKGLEGVIVTKTTISKIDGTAGRLVYRGYDAGELSRKVSFEEATCLLWFGRLPSPAELREFTEKISENFELDTDILDFLRKTPPSVDPLSLLRTATSYIGMIEARDSIALESALSLLSKYPLILSSFNRFRSGLELVPPSKELTFAEKCLHLITGKIPASEEATALNSYLILLADHGLNASTFSALVTISALSDYYSAVTSAVGTLMGPLHGGAPSKVWEMFLQIGRPENAREWLEERIKTGSRIMGFGHRVYRTEDPRSRALKSIARKIAKPEVFELAEVVEETAREILQREHPDRVLETNVEFYSSVVLNAVGIPTDMFTAIFACSRLVGWSAHILEQLSDNRIFRPESEYVGPEGLTLS